LIINIKSPLAMRQRAFYVDMDVKRKVPYRELLYYFLVNSKNPDVPADVVTQPSLLMPFAILHWHQQTILLALTKWRFGKVLLLGMLAFQD
jgi:hypothetical protein